MDDRKIKALSKCKLKEFQRWRAVAGFHPDQVKINDGWTIDLIEYDQSDYNSMSFDWQREAPEEVNEIIKAINAITRPKRRAILIMSFIMLVRTKEQLTDLAMAESSYHREKALALLDFAERYRNGVIKSYIERVDVL